jgi:hypothetical protein
MAKKKNNKINFKNSHHSALIISILAFAVAGVALVYSASAAPRVNAPIGSIEVSPDSVLKYGGTVSFDTTISDYNTNKKGVAVYASVVCSQPSIDRSIVFQYSGSPDLIFPLVQQKGLEAVGAIWETTEPATCTAWYIYREEKGKGSVIETMDIVDFKVAPQ